ncbi:hypothetical protein C2W62_28835 [Candidatus Entotheonella serta]|nr:hypothetical protein C2W62_28835 [Candidatus Entotheonella serta]
MLATIWMALESHRETGIPKKVKGAPVPGGHRRRPPPLPTPAQAPVSPPLHSLRIPAVSLVFAAARSPLSSITGRFDLYHRTQVA